MKMMMQQNRRDRVSVTNGNCGFALLLGFALAFTSSLVAAEHRVSSAADIARISAEAKPGDVIVMSDGEWNDQAVVLGAKGTAEKPITLRAQTPGKVVLTDKSLVTIDGEHLVVSGLNLQPGTATGDGGKLSGRNNRLTESAVVGGSYKFFVHLLGTSNRFDHCYLAGKTNDDPTLQVEGRARTTITSSIRITSAIARRSDAMAARRCVWATAISR